MSISVTVQHHRKISQLCGGERSLLLMCLNAISPRQQGQETLVVAVSGI